MDTVRSTSALIKLMKVVPLLLVLCGVLHPHAALATTCNSTPAPGTWSDTDFQALLTHCAGQTITFSAGTYLFTPSAYQHGFNIPTGTTLEGNGSSGANKTIFQIASSGAYQALLWVRDTSNITIEKIDFEDIDANNKTYASGCANTPVAYFGNAIYLYSDPQTTPPSYSSIENIVIQDNVFHDFNGDAWIDFLAEDLSPGVGQDSEIAISSNTFETDASLNGGCAATEGQHVYAISIHGSINYPNSGLVENVSIADNQFDTSYIEGAVAIWSDTSLISVQYNIINGAGNMLPHVTGEPYRYAISVYSDAYEAKNYNPPQPGNGLPPDTIWIVGNTITRPETCGIYALTATNLDIQSNTISGQTDTDDETLPKGAIVLNNGSTTMSGYPLESNTLFGNYVGLAVVLGSNNGLVATGSNQITVPSNSYGAKLTLGPNTTATLDFQGIILTATSGTTNATSVVGFGNPGSNAFIGMAQNGWTATGGANPALIWYDTPAMTTKYTSFSQVPNVTFGNVHNPITASGGTQGAFWQ
jgi:hypothetical protein